MGLLTNILLTHHQPQLLSEKDTPRPDLITNGMHCLCTYILYNTQVLQVSQHTFLFSFVLYICPIRWGNQSHGVAMLKAVLLSLSAPKSGFYLLITVCFLQSTIHRITALIMICKAKLWYIIVGRA